MPFGRGPQALELGRVSLVAAKGTDIVLVPWREPGETRTLPARSMSPGSAMWPSESLPGRGTRARGFAARSRIQPEEGGCAPVETDDGRRCPMTAFTYFKDH